MLSSCRDYKEYSLHLNSGHWALTYVRFQSVYSGKGKERRNHQYSRCRLLPEVSIHATKNIKFLKNTLNVFSPHFLHGSSDRSMKPQFANASDSCMITQVLNSSWNGHLTQKFLVFSQLASVETHSSRGLNVSAFSYFLESGWVFSPNHVFHSWITHLLLLSISLLLPFQIKKRF